MNKDRMIKKIAFTLLSIVMTVFAFCQDLPPGFFDTNEKKLDSARLVVTYRMQLALDTNNLARRVSDLFVLHIGDSISSFLPMSLYETRTGMKKANVKSFAELIAFAESQPPPTNRTGSFFEVYKNYPVGNITTRDKIFNNIYLYTEDINNLDWVISGRENEYLGLKTIHAKTNYKGREWIAWFAPDIPVSEGPYKFHGLPGLIVQMGDSEGLFAIVMESVEQPVFPTEILFPLEPGVIETTISNFIKARNSFANNPSHTIGAFISDPHTRAVAASTAGRRNNFIERSAD